MTKKTKKKSEVASLPRCASKSVGITKTSNGYVISKWGLETGEKKYIAKTMDEAKMYVSKALGLK